MFLVGAFSYSLVLFLFTTKINDSCGQDMSGGEGEGKMPKIVLGFIYLSKQVGVR